MNDFKPLDINADRICEAISKIGYNPCSAILDIVDNSVVAKARNIAINLFIKEGTTVNTRQNLAKIQIIDDGIGMIDNEVETALQLGSDVKYGKNSLSKYGLGLKSAGFSLGNVIEIISKKNKKYTKLKYLDRAVIRSKGVFGVLTKDVDEKSMKLLSANNSGTVVTIKDINYTSKFSAQKISGDLENQAGVNYCDILKENNIRIVINILTDNQESETLKTKSIHPRDILFWDDAHESFLKESYECKRPCRVLDDSFENPLNPEGARIKIKATIFPMDKMKSFQGFSEEERELIKSFEVGSKNSGFFFYRNGRLIKWGEKLFLNRVFGFRAKIEFETEHDDLFDVDVSKQHLSIPEEIEKTIRVLCETPVSQSTELFDLCNALIKDADNIKEGNIFNVRNIDLEEDEEETPGKDYKEVKRRKELLEEESDKLLEKMNESKYDNIDNQEVFLRIRYWDKSNDLNLWQSCTDRIEGTYSLINKKHPYYNHTLSKYSPNDPIRQSIEAFIYALSVGEVQTIKKFIETDDVIVKKMFSKFLRTVSHQLDHWVNNNWDLFEDGN